MGGGGEPQIWVTYALTNDDVPKALTLCSSLRRVLTSRKIGVIVSRKLSNPLKECLHQAFDFYFPLEEERNKAGMKDVDFVKLYALTLKPFGKCVVLSPSMLALNNCDNIFDDYNIPSAHSFVLGGEDLSVFLVRPCLNTFWVLMSGVKGACNGNGMSVTKYLRDWTKNQKGGSGGDFKRLPEEKYNLVLNSSKIKAPEGDITKVSIVNLTGVGEEEDPEKCGLFSKMILQYRKLIFDETVAPLLQTTETILTGIPVDLACSELWEQNQFQQWSREPIAIVGMSCRFPCANNLEEFWKLLINAQDGLGVPPEYRWNSTLCVRNPTPFRNTKAGFIEKPMEEFDSKLFGLSPYEMEYLDPQARLLHELVWEGLEDASVNPHGLRGTSGSVFIGSWTNDYKEILEADGSEPSEFFRTYMGNSIGASAARISQFLGLTGPSIATESGCSSAMVAVHLACRSLRLRETNFALACGVNLLLHPFDKDEMPMVLSPEGCCKTFDEKADGFARAEGCGVLVLKRLSDAVREGDKIWALIRGSGMSQEGVSKSMGTPTVHCESLAMKKALRDAGVEPSQVSYVEAHGTGTVVGDPMEVAAIAKAYHSKERKEPLLIGSVKTNVGHTESCSGITGIMKVVLAMQHEVIPPHRNFEKLNPSIDLDAVPAKIPLEPVEWQKEKGKARLAGVSSFGMTGTDAHVILEEAPLIPPNAMDGVKPLTERPLHILKISGKTEEAMNILIEKYKEHFSKTKDDFKDMAYSANIGRADFSHRAVVIAKSKEDAIKSIETNKIMRAEMSAEGVGKICFLFTGQGSQYPGMAKQLYETSPVFRMHFEYCEKILKNSYNIDITQVLWSENKSNEVSRTIYSQTSIFCVEYALLKLWESWGVKADFALGHSLGEFAAAVCAGILTVEDAIKLVAERSRLIDLLPRGKMLVIKADKQRVDSLMKKFAGNDKNKLLDYAAINSPDQTVVAGDSDLIMQFSASCKEANLKCIILEATHAFHSKHMDPMLDDYRKVAQTIQKLDGNDCQYISGMRGFPLNPQDINAEYWVEHTREKVLFLDASKKAVELGCKTFIEIGPQPVLSALTMMNNATSLLCLPSLKRNEKEWETLLTTLGKLYLHGLEINWKGLDTLLSSTKVPLPHYPFIGKKFWPDLSSVGGTPIHPLVGIPLPNPTSTKLFQTGLNLRSLEYLKGHSIGDHVIFPGAGYLEMCLASGLAAIENTTNVLTPPSRAMKVEHLSFEAPLPLNESSTCQLQTVVELSDLSDINIKIYRKIDVDSKWLLHAKAKFSSVVSSEETQVSFDPSHFSQRISQPADEHYIHQIYEKLASSGLKFGPTFRRLEKVWMDDKQEGFIVKILPPSWQDPLSNQYIGHPVILDAMVQAAMVVRFGPTHKKKMYVPIKIGKFLWLSPIEPEGELYIHAYIDEPNGFGSARLLNSEGKVLAVMSPVEYTDTSVKVIDSILEQQTIAMPQLWEETWKGELGPWAGRVELSEIKGKWNELNLIPDDCNTPPPKIAGLFSQVEHLVYLYMVRSLQELGWTPVLGKVFGEEELGDTLQIRGFYRQYFGFILEVLETEGILERVGDKWKVKRMPYSLEESEKLLSSAEWSSELISRYNTAPLLTKVGEILSKILSGKQEALPILFPEEREGYPSVSDFYTTYKTLFGLEESIRSKSRRRLTHIRNMMESRHHEKIPVLRILEVGAGTGSFTEILLEPLEKSGVEFEYTYTDISAAFFPAVEKRFEKHLTKFHFKKLNIEEDPLEQGFAPEYFDIICASDVIHATKNVKESLKNLRVLLKPNGLLDIQEMTRKHRFVTYLFGLLEGFWRFEDFELRPRHCTISTQEWTSVLNSTGFEVDGIFPMMNSYHSYIWGRRTESQLLKKEKPRGSSKVWLLFQRKCEDINMNEELEIETRLKVKFEQCTNRKVITVLPATHFEVETGENIAKIRFGVEDDFVALLTHLQKENLSLEGIIYCWPLSSLCSQEEVLRPYFYLTKSLLLTTTSGKIPKLICVTKGLLPVKGDVLSNLSSANFHTSTLLGFTKSLKNENQELGVKVVDVEGSSLLSADEIFWEVWSWDKEIMLAYRGGNRFYPKLQAVKATTNSLKLPHASDRFQLILPESRSISELQFGTLDEFILKENEVEVQIKASALNFRDLLSILKPSEEFKDINTVGFDFAGVIKRIGEKVTKWKVGDRVSGCNIHFTAMPSHVILDEDLLLPVQSGMSLCEAATIPAVYMTSLLCLFEVAQVKKEDVVLIHTASGGVGLSAIEICKHVGCTIIATAGSKRKQNYLKSLGIQHIFHSRNTQYGDQILELTKGRGVDVVLNSLTSEGFKEATLKACAKSARFVEMSKLNIWTEDEVRKLRPDIKYTTVDLSLADKTEWIRLMNKLKTLSEEGIINPIPYTRFDALNIQDALKYLQKAKHIGKVVCTMPELRRNGAEMQIWTRMFNENSTYLITGGLGGIGFVVCKWIIEKGGKHVILASRRPPTPSIQEKINALNAEGAHIIPVQLDIRNIDELKELLNSKLPAFSFPPLKGVMHAAGIIADGLVVNQDWLTLSSTFAAKIEGTLNLHELTKSLNLEHFVLFSSIATLIGNPGQCNHAAGNQFEDAFAHYRHSIGLPATTINWGQWGEVGVATEVELPGLKTLSNLQGVTGLEYALKKQRTQTAIFNIHSFTMLSKLCPHLAVLLDERLWKKNEQPGISSVSLKSDEFWQEWNNLVSNAHTEEEKLSVVTAPLRNILRDTLKLDKNEAIGDEADLQEMGVDSLMFVEIKNGLQTLFGERLPISPSVLKGCQTLSQMGTKLVHLIEGGGVTSSNHLVVNDLPPSMEEVNALMREDCPLPTHIRAKPGQKAKDITEVKTVLLTGATGALGPYILKEITALPQITKVICLLRPLAKRSAEERLTNHLREMELLSTVNMKKVQCVNGNVGAPHLGLQPEVWKKLIMEVDAVFHCAANVQHTELYKKRESKNDMRAVNIGGTKNVLEFACEGQLKHVYHASTLLAVFTLGEDGRMSEEWPEVGDYDNIMKFAYPITKFVGDVLMKQAVERGIPCKVFRFPFIAGESGSGRCSMKSNHVLLRFIFIMKNGMMPSTPTLLHMLPVDFCAEVSIRLFFREEAPPDIFNINHGEPDTDQEFAEVASKFGYTVDMVDYPEFARRVQDGGGGRDQNGNGVSPLEMFKDFYKDDEDAILSIYTSAPLLRKWVEEGGQDKDMWWSEKVTKVIPDFFQRQKSTMHYVYRDLAFCKSQGWLHKFGL